MSRHGPARNQQHKPRNKVALGCAVPVPAQPDTRQTGGPPDHAHGGVLPVVAHPGGAPPVLGEGVDATPGGDDGAVEELLAAAGAAEPELADKQDDGQEDAVGDKGAAHDEVGQALAEVVTLAETESGDAAEEHLHPGGDGESLAVDAVQNAEEGPDATLEALLEVELEIDAESNLDDHHKEENVGEASVHVVGDELSALVQVTECVSEEGEGGREDLEWDVPAALDYLLSIC